MHDREHDPSHVPGNFPLAILAKAPLPGRVKTRLIPRLGEDGAAQLHERLLRHALDIALKATSAEQIVLWTALEHYHPLFLELAERHAIRLLPQPDGDLGERMFQALAMMKEPGLVIGSDCPVLTPVLLQDCHRALTCADAVFLPAEDGGYALAGVQRPERRLFEDIDWGTPRVMDQTRAQTTALGWKVDFPTQVWDIDRPEDLDRFEREVERWNVG